MVYLPAASLRSFGEARPAGRFKSSVMFTKLGHVTASSVRLISDKSIRIFPEGGITENNAVLLVEF